MQSMDEDRLALDRIRRGDDRAVNELMARHKEALFRFVFRYTGNSATAAELTEETFFRVYQHAGKFKPRSKVKTWIFSIAMNLCRDHTRRQRKHRGTVSLFSDETVAGDRVLLGTLRSDARTPVSEASSNESLAAIESAIQSLPPKLKDPFIFCVLEDHSYDECAVLLKTSTKAVETRIYRARARLREALADLLAGRPDAKKMKGFPES